MNDQPAPASSPSPSRREFLKLSSGALAASALAGVVVPRVHAAENPPIKLALVGCGPRGTGAVADAFSTTGGPLQLYAMADLFENRIQAAYNNLSRVHPEKVAVTPERRFLGFDAYKQGHRLPGTWRRGPAHDVCRLSPDAFRNTRCRRASTCSWRSRLPPTRPASAAC